MPTRLLSLVVASAGVAFCGSAFAEPPKLTGVRFSCMSNATHIFEGPDALPSPRALATPAMARRQFPDDPCNAISSEQETARSKGEKFFWFVGVDGQTRLFEDGRGRSREGKNIIDAVSGPYTVVVKVVPKPSESAPERPFDFFAAVDVIVEVCRGSECTSSSGVSQIVFNQIF